MAIHMKSWVRRIRLLLSLLSVLAVTIWFKASLQVQGSEVQSGASLTEKEVEYSKNCGVLRVGVPKDNCPLSYIDKDTKELKGITVDIMKAIGAKLSLNFEFVPYDLSISLQEHIDSKEFDLIVPLGGKYDYDVVQRARISDRVYQGSIIFVSLNNFEYSNPDFEIGIVEDQADYQEYITEKYPNFQILQYETQSRALLALKRGEVKALAENIFVYDYLLQSPIYEDLKTMSGMFIGLDYCVLQPREGDIELFELLNKGIHMLSEQEAASIIYQYRGNNIYTYTLRDYLYLYRWVVFAAIVIACFLAIIAHQRKRNCNVIREINLELIEANKSKSRFLTNMSHEIRNPVNAIIGLTSICENNLEDKELLRINCEKVQMSARFLLDLLTDILDISRIESGKMVIKEEVVNFNEFILQINSMIGERIEAKGINYECIIGDLVASHYVFDRIKLQQVIINIMSNAIKFTPKEGKVRLQIDQDKIVESKALLSIRIIDTGVGVNEEFLPKMFDVFTQEYNDNTTLYSGSGLGLAICKNLVKLLNGDIEVISKKGEGTTFLVKVFISVANENQKGMEQVQKDGQIDYSDLANKRILLVEDNEINLEVAKTILEHVGILVDCEENGEACVERFAQAENGYYHAILMDIRMPVMDGLDATKRIRKLPREDAKRIPIIAMTANAFEEDIKNSINVGMNYHMTKPIEPKILYEILTKVIND